MRNSLLLILALASQVSADIVGKGGEIRPASPPGESSSSSIRGDYEINTAGLMEAAPTMAGSAEGWGGWFVTVLHNDSGQALRLTELGFPCTGPPSDEWGWLVWTDLGDSGAPGGAPESADHHGQFTPAVDDGAAPPQVYAYVDLSGETIIIPESAWFGFGYQVTDLGGQVEAGDHATWAWFDGAWDPDAAWGRMAVLQVKADFDEVAVGETSWSDLKRLY